MTIADMFLENFVSPAILFFFLGVIAGFIKSDLEVPESISRYLSIYLMMAIGFKGGVAIAGQTSFDLTMLLVMAGGMCIGFLQPYVGYFLLHRTTRLDKATAAAASAHYGSISMVTFVTAVSFLEANALIYAGYIVAVVALMEAPAIFSGLHIAHQVDKKTIKAGEKAAPKLYREIFTNGAILLLAGAFLIGWATGESGYNKMYGFLVEPFDGILALFLLDMGLLVSRQLHHLKDFSVSLFLFGIYMPLLGAVTGIGLSSLLGLDIGTALLFTILLASASYIAVPAAMRLALPQAKPGIYLTLSLAVTFPFNILVGIPLYFSVLQDVL